MASCNGGLNVKGNALRQPGFLFFQAFDFCFVHLSHLDSSCNNYFILHFRPFFLDARLGV